MAAADTTTGTAAELPPSPVIVMVHVPTPSGVTSYPAPFVPGLGVTVAMIPESGAQVSLSTNVPEYPVCVTTSATGAFEPNVIDAGDALTATGEGDAVGEGDGDGLAVGVADAAGVGTSVGVAVGAGAGDDDPPLQAVHHATERSAAARSNLVI
jgi:hypothetical protein